jgi:predicted O-methyltransferase YrrM
MKFGENDNVKIDIAHANLIKGLVQSHKPNNVLELGIGGGASADVIVEALEYNQKSYSFTIVDNWYDFSFTMPKEVEERYGKFAEIVTSDEKEYIFNCKEKYDFIMSDADHFNTEKWFDYVYDNILNENGILIYHDINIIEDSFPNLREILYNCQRTNKNHYLFNMNSRTDERCYRGLLVIFKNK